MGQGALSKPSVKWWLSLNSSSGVVGEYAFFGLVLGVPCRCTSRLPGCFRSHLMGVQVGSRALRGTPATHYPARLRTTPQACRNAPSPRHVDEKSWMVGDGGCL